MDDGEPSGWPCVMKQPGRKEPSGAAGEPSCWSSSMVELGEREIALAPSCACGPRDRSTDLRASTSRLSASACKGNGRAEEKLVGITRRVGRGLMNRGRDIEGGGTALQPITTAQAERPRGVRRVALGVPLKLALSSA